MTRDLLTLPKRLATDHADLVPLDWQRARHADLHRRPARRATGPASP